MKAAAEHLSALAASLRPRVAYVDLDGTLLGPGGSLFAAAGGGVTERAAGALAALHRAGVDVVPVSGRTVHQLLEVARVVGARDFVAELGGVTCYDLGRESVRHYGAYRGAGTPYRGMADSGAAGLLLEAFAGRLELHTPWAYLERECSMLLRGHVDPAEARAALEEAAYGWLDLLDNGVIAGTSPGLRTAEVHAYHLLPRGVTKAAAAAADRERRGLSRDECIAVGDSPSDAEMAAEVGAAFIVANGRAAVEAAGGHGENVYATEGRNGEGFAEVVEALVGGG